ncbi:hypothetical protein [Aeromicrobium sp. CTD01-1L150]|uniref:hypothetical protein n=1 Tax=Aeromicrobium sp. CTD01-1L150 TaxID=3341830 RepID=UPI0035BFF396
MSTPTISTHADVAALMIAAVDDRPAMSELLKTLRVGDLPDMFLAAIEVGGTMIRFGDELAEASARDTLDGMLSAFREVQAEGGAK